MSLIVHGFIFSDLFSTYAGWIVVVFGVLLALAGGIWIPGPSERPLGVTLLAASYALGGFIILVLGGWVLTILFLPAVIFFALAWALLKGLAWSRIGACLVAALGILLSFAGVGSDGVTNLPGILGGVYILWYLNRSHVAEFFHEESLPTIPTSRRFLAIPLLIILTLIPFFAYLYLNPPTAKVISERIETWSTGGGGGSGHQFYASRGDVIDYSYQVIRASPVRVYFELSDIRLRLQCPSSGSPVGGSFSGRVVLPCSGSWYLLVESNGTHTNTQVEETKTMFSLRPSIVQWILLCLYIAGVFVHRVSIYQPQNRLIA